VNRVYCLKNIERDRTNVCDFFGKVIRTCYRTRRHWRLTPLPAFDDSRNNTKVSMVSVVVEVYDWLAVLHVPMQRGMSGSVYGGGKPLRGLLDASIQARYC
jgi:hypothetical protein